MSLDVSHKVKEQLNYICPNSGCKLQFTSQIVYDCHMEICSRNSFSNEQSNRQNNFAFDIGKQEFIKTTNLRVSSRSINKALANQQDNMNQCLKQKQQEAHEKLPQLEREKKNLEVQIKNKDAEILNLKQQIQRFKKNEEGLKERITTLEKSQCQNTPDQKQQENIVQNMYKNPRQNNFFPQAKDSNVKFKPYTTIFKYGQNQHELPQVNQF